MKKLLISALIGLSFTTCLFCDLGKERVAVAMIVNEGYKANEAIGEAIIGFIPESYDEVDTASEPANKAFTLEELKKYNGQNGNPAYIAIDGTVYDVTNIKRWKNGKHCNVTAGNDLSKEIGSSPHGKDVLKKVPIVGILK